MTNRTRAGLLTLVLTVGLGGCGGATPQPPTGPSPVQQPPQVPGGFPPGVLSDYTLTGVVFEVTANGRTPIAGASVYCELCGTETHSWASTDSNGFYSFTGVWNAGVSATELRSVKDGYTDPAVPPGSTPPNTRGPGWRKVMVNGDTRFDIELARR